MFTRRSAYLACGLLATLAYVVVPLDVQTVLYMGIAASTPVAIVVGVRRFRPASRTPWYLMAVGFALYVVGDSVYTAYEYTPDGPPYPNVGDFAYLAFYPLVFLAMGMVLRSGGQRNRAAWLDASIWSAGVALLAWEPIVEPVVLDTESELLARVVSVAYPLMDIGLLLMVLRMLAGRTGRTPTYGLLMLALASQTTADVIFALQIFDPGTLGERLADTGWLLTYVLVGTAALQPTMVAMTEPSQAPAMLSSRLRLASLLIPILLAPGLLMYQLLTGQLGGEVADGFVVAGAWTVLVMLVLARGAGLLGVAERRSAELTERQAQLQAALTERERSNAELFRRVTKDALTGLANRDYFVTALEKALAKCGKTTSIAFLDLDDFKSINDTLGHEAGDLLLIEIARRMEAAVAEGDLVARFGGDEFAVLLGGDVEQLAERLLTALQKPLVLHGRELRLQVSIGITTAGTAPCSTGDLLRRADIAMYAAKRAGGGWTRYQTGMSELLRRRVDLRAQLVAGLGNGEVTAWFQPVVDLDSGELRGFEALARWLPADGSVQMPSEWLCMAEETGLVVEVDRAVWRASFVQLAAWRSTYPAARDLHLAINLSALTLQHVGVAEELIATLVELEVPASRIVVEVTEGVLIDDQLVSARLQLLRAAGMRVALDDFGTGWSSLSYLQKFPVDLLKLDCTFTAELGQHPGGAAIPAAVLQLARALSLDVVAEGVETLEQLDHLVALGFHNAQGYLFGKAEPAHQLVGLLSQRVPRIAVVVDLLHPTAAGAECKVDEPEELAPPLQPVALVTT